jgi:hypothetical protein
MSVAESIVILRPPRGVPQRLARRDFREVARGHIAERAARCRQHKPVDSRDVLAPQALPDRAVLAVDGPQLATALLRRLGHDVPGHDEHFLVGEGYRLARPERRQRRHEPGHAGRGDDDEVDRRIGGDLLHGRPARLRAGRRLELHVACAVLAPDEGRLELARLVLEEGVVAAAGQPDDAEAAGEPPDDIERLAPDRARRTEDCDALHRLTHRAKYSGARGRG